MKHGTNDIRDLGFGTRVRTGRGERLLDRDGSFTVRRTGMPLRALISLSHRLLAMRWPPFLGLIALGYFGLNAAFALIYLGLGEHAIGGPLNLGDGGEAGFSRAFFFSVQTASTIGYGQLYPASAAANLTATVEALVALVCFALVTGMTYARFTRPIADIVFSDHATVAPYRDGSGLMLRVANQRKSQILGLQARCFLLRVVRDGERTSRTFDELVLERRELAFFPLSWTLVHPIDESSPLSGVGEVELLDCDAELLVTLTGIDETFSHTVHARSSYLARDIVWGARFANIYEHGEGGTPTAIDLARIDELETPAAAGG